jgi:outer membrane protein OmpA-like peptidoglycan-associated protein
VNFLLTGGRAGTKGELTFSAGSGPAKVNYQGGVQVAEFGAVEKDGQQDLLRWKTLALDALQFDLEPFQLRIGEITLADFYSRLVLGADGKLNLQNLTAQDGKQADPPAEEKPAGAKAAAKTAETKPVEKAPAQTADAEPPKAINIGKINLKEGNIHFSDFFVKPNYSANLTGVQGAISELKPETPGDLDIQARLDNAAPVDIKGKLNPLSKDLFLDIVADAKDIELSPMTPYSAKYVGYGIERGKLSFNVKYKVENRKLTANNKIVLNQLTFGEKIESPTATKLPVLLAVAIMKDRNGVIDVDLPISGSLDDPQFSVGGIVLRIVINLITRAVTAPFSLLASAFGGGAGGGDELSYIEFDTGKANLNQAAQSKIATLARALNNRPALNLEIIGRVDPLSDLEGLKRAGIERKVKAQKLKELARKGEAPRSVDEVQIAPAEYPQFLKAAYGEESFPKPRNMIGLAQDLPVPEMEKLMMQHAKATDDDMRQLASQRAQAVRDALLASKQVTGERLFVVAGKPFTPEERAKLKGRPNRVDFSMK